VKLSVATAEAAPPVGEDIRSLSYKLGDAFSEDRAHIDARFDQVDERFDRVDERFNRLDDRIDSLEARMDARFDQMDIRFEKLTARIDARFEEPFGHIKRDEFKR
jgi:hypothetical protein